MATEAFAIDTPRLRLRNWRDRDFEPFARDTNTPSVMRWLGGVKSEAELRDMFAERLVRWQEERGFTFWAVERKADGELLGFCGLKLADGPGCGFLGEYEAGWRLREDAWGRGYAKEAAAASFDFAFDRLGAERVFAVTFIGNEPSWGLMERLGMRRRPDLDYHDPRFGEHNPTIVYEMERQAWWR